MSLDSSNEERLKRILALLDDVEEVQKLAEQQRDDAIATIRQCEHTRESLRALIIELTVDADLSS